MSRRDFLRASGVVGVSAALPKSVLAQSTDRKVFRWAFLVAETGFDPAQISDLYSRTVCRNIFDALLTYDYLARPVKLKPNVTTTMPEVSSDFRRYTFRLKPNIFFADDAAFKGAQRELVAEDFAYSFKRHFDPRWKSPSYGTLEAAEIVGMDEARKEALKTGRFDYDRPIEGLRALDRYTFQLVLGKSNPRFIYQLADNSVLGAVAREVVDMYGDQIMAHPVGTGPFKLGDWRRSSRIVLDRNPTYRNEFYDAEPAANDIRSQAIFAALKGRKLPMIDQVEIGVIDESQPRWLAFLNEEHDMIEAVPPEFIRVAIPQNRLAPNLAKRGIEMDRIALPEIVVSYFNMEDTVVGGFAAEKVALRRAISLAYNQDLEINLIRKGQMVPASSPVGPQTFGYDPSFLTDAATYDLARAKALLDTYGYTDRNSDGWREQPDGSQLVLEYATQSDPLSKQYNELWKKGMDDLGVRITFSYGKWPEQLKASRAGKLMMWGVAWVAGVPDCETFLDMGHSRFKGLANRARFDMRRYDELHERQHALSDGEERLAIVREMKRYFAAYMPYKLHGHRFRTDLTHPWLIGYRRHPFSPHVFKYVDIDTSLQPTRRG
ncbi:MAG: ABC transporter substrate-binding protein [Pseudomonadota bacterium]|nr:ABC transporter substrate-binding protein [Pseudomonadota bacterium]